MKQSDPWYSAGEVAQSLAANYERYLVPTIFGPWVSDLVALATPQPGERILDVACGTGAVAREAARVIGAEGRVTGLDLNAGMLNIARAHDLQGTVQWREGSAQAMPFPEEVFTLVLCQQGMQYFPDRVAALREMHRVLTSGVLLHSGGLHCGEWDDQFAVFSMSYLVVRYDWRGYGASQMPRQAFSHVQDLHAVLAGLQLVKPALLGFLAEKCGLTSFS